MSSVSSRIAWDNFAALDLNAISDEYPGGIKIKLSLLKILASFDYPGKLTFSCIPTLHAFPSRYGTTESRAMSFSMVRICSTTKYSNLYV